MAAAAALASSNGRGHSFAAALLATLFVLASPSLLGSPVSATSRPRKLVLRYYAHQQFGVNEFSNVPAAVPPVNGTRQGIGLQVLYSYDLSKGPNATTSDPLGFIRGISTVASNTVDATFFVVNTVVHYSDPSFRHGTKHGLSGTFTTQGESDFGSGNPWEFAITGGTGDFRNALGYAVGRVYSFVPPTANSTAKVTTFYKTHLWLEHL